TNAGSESLSAVEPGIFSLQLQPVGPHDFHWMTGGENQPDMWLLQTEQLAPGKPRRFDSYDPFPTKRALFPGDGIRARIFLNDHPIWPANGWQYVPNATVTVPFDLNTSVRAGDKLVFLVNMNQNIGFDTTTFDPIIRYDTGETHIASHEFSGEQGRNGWRYQYRENGRFIDLVYYPQHQQWRKAVDNATGTPFVGPTAQHPDSGQDAARVWTAPHDGHVRITGSISNTGNQFSTGTYGFRMGSSSYAPWVALQRRDSGAGIFIGWDYFGHWASSYEADGNGVVTARMRVAGHHQTLAPGESVSAPQAFAGLFRDDLDDAGNELLDWQYRYLWDYTREGWFPAIRMLGYWWKGTGWGRPAVGWTGGDPDFGSAFRKIFRVADLMREVGGDVYHRDWGWWDRAGDWNGPDFRSTHDYLRKYGIGQLIYAFLYTVDPKSKVAQDHPNWVLGGSTLDLSRPEVVQFIEGQLEQFYQKWSDFEWRNDSTPTSPHGADDTPLLKQDEGFRQVIRAFLDRHPDCAFQSVNGGGNDAGYDYVRYSSTIQFSDGAVGIHHNHYASLLFPPDKTNDNPDQWNPDHFDVAAWRRLLCSNFDMTGDTWDPVKLEGLREQIDIYHYLQAHGVVGRWARVYRRRVVGDDPVLYFQRLSRDRLRAMIIPKRSTPGPVTIWPKGLLANARYVVSFQVTPDAMERSGSDLMGRGISLQTMAPGELIYLKLPMHPGSKVDTIPPTPPANAKKRLAENMGYPGVEVVWAPGSDNNWVSYYEAVRDGDRIGRAAKGHYFFDHSAGADPAARYEIVTVDGAGNRSGSVLADGPIAPRARVVDDADPAARFTGPWRRETDLEPAHAGTISSTEAPGASVEITFSGGRVLWFSKLGSDCGVAHAQLDQEPIETIDTYSADDIWGVCVYQKRSPAGDHRLRITVTGDHASRSSGNLVYVDGFRVEP
ncbi:MAG TPA: hypothetical protein VFJ58_27455, partial [Armatimonadota bacterium]|nr:hypothetical protein [Armatimonadota bacterium]